MFNVSPLKRYCQTAEPQTDDDLTELNWSNIAITLKIQHSGRQSAVLFFFHSSENCLTVLFHFFSTNAYHACCNSF